MGIDQPVPLAATQLVGSIIASHTFHSGGLDRLTIHDGGTRMRLTSRPGPNCLPQGGMDLRPEPPQPPEPRIIGRGFPRWQTMGREAPGTATAE